MNINSPEAHTVYEAGELLEKAVKLTKVDALIVEIDSQISSLQIKRSRAIVVKTLMSRIKRIYTIPATTNSGVTFKTPQRIILIEKILGERVLSIEELFKEFQSEAEPHLKFSAKYAFKAALKTYIEKGRIPLRRTYEGLYCHKDSTTYISKDKGLLRKDLISKILIDLTKTKKGNMRSLTLFNKFQEAAKDSTKFATYNDFRQALKRYIKSGTHFDITVGKAPESWIYIKSIKA